MMWTAAPWWHWLGMASLWAVLVLVAIWATGRIAPAGRTRRPAPHADLDVRFAQGEIGSEEYRRLRHELTATAQDQGA